MWCTTPFAVDCFCGVIHVPDVEKNPHWSKLRHIYLLNRTPFRSSGDLTIITWNNKVKGPFEISCSNHGIECEVLGKNINQWSNYFKFDLTLEFIKRCNTKYIMGCDSHDCLLVDHPFEILERFIKTNAAILFNSEICFYPNINELIPKQWKLFEESISVKKLRYLNSGSWIARTEDANIFFEKCNSVRIYDLFDCSNYQYLRKQSIGCDQSSVHQVFMETWPLVQLDYDARCFLNIANFGKDDLEFNHKLL